MGRTVGLRQVDAQTCDLRRIRGGVLIRRKELADGGGCERASRQDERQRAAVAPHRRTTIGLQHTSGAHDRGIRHFGQMQKDRSDPIESNPESAALD